MKKVDDGGRADGANTGRITEQDVAVGAGVVGALSGVGVLIEGASLIGGVIITLGVINNIDEIGTNHSGESISKQMFNDKSTKETISNIKQGVGILNIFTGVKDPNLLKSPFKIGSTATDIKTVIDKE